MNAVNVPDAVGPMSEMARSPRLIVVEQSLQFHNITYNQTHHTTIYTDGTMVTHANHVPEFGAGLAHSLSSWYQLNMGLIGIGALAVVAIIGSRNFFSNFMSSKYPYDRYDNGYGYDMYGNGGGYGSSGYDEYDRKSWYDEWYDHWYRNNPDPYLDNDLEDPKESRSADPYAREDYYQHHRRYGRNLKFRDKNKNEGDPQITNTGKGSPEKRDTGQISGVPANKYFNETYEEVMRSNDSENDTSNVKSTLGKGAAHCAFRLLCELSRLRKRPLNKDEWEIIRLIKFRDLGATIFKPGVGLLPDSGVIDDYSVASRLGAEQYQCQKLLGTCRMSKKKLASATTELKERVENLPLKKIAWPKLGIDG